MPALENGDETLAGTWARWVMRTNPAIVIDTVAFPQGVVTALRTARTAVGSRTAGDDVTRMAYQWPAVGNRAAP